jgi:hypothetical protein
MAKIKKQELKQAHPNKIDKSPFPKNLFHDQKLKACIRHALHNHVLLMLLILGIPH